MSDILTLLHCLADEAALPSVEEELDGEDVAVSLLWLHLLHQTSIPHHGADGLLRGGVD